LKYGIWILIGLLLLLHQDYWQWSETTLDFGFLPRGLSFHVGVSLAAGVAWWLATVFCWPIDEDERSSQEPDA